MIYVNEKYRFLFCLIHKSGSTAGLFWLLAMEDLFKDDIIHQHGQSSKDWWKCSEYADIWNCADTNLRKLKDYPTSSKYLLENYCKIALANLQFKKFKKWKDFPPHLKSRKYLIKNYYKIIIVRNPWRKLVSVYLDKFCTGNYYLIEESKYAAKYIYDKYSLDHKNHDDYKNGGGITFSQFLNYIDNHPDEMFDPHWKPQYLSMEGLSFDSIIKIENIRHDIRSVINKLGIKEDWPSIQLSNIVYQELKDDYSIYYPQHLIKIKKEYGYFPSYKNFYTENLISLVCERYKKDIELFNYNYEV